MNPTSPITDTGSAASGGPGPSALAGGPGASPLALEDLEESLPFSYARPAEPLAESIAALGLLRPLWVWRAGSRWKILAGNLRFRALKLLGATEAPAICPPPGVSWPRALAWALADNQGRAVNPAETALVWRFLVENLGPAEAASLAGPLGLAQAPKLRDRCLAAAALPPRGLAALADGRLDLAAAARLAGWPAADREAALDLFEALNPSLSKKRAWLDWLEDLARRDGLTPAQILAAPDIRAALAEADRRGRPAAEAEARSLLFRRRHPLLAALKQKRADRIKALNLPPSVRLETDPNFEDLSFSLTLTFEGLADFRALADLARGLADDSAFQDLLDDGHD
ncbi:MAG: ParB/RepB/Spo0J family partition protein [Candidatus Adiutrix sp.]|nr:ParB/RepB/Spo0J family partition protein [Candidatus Adiutrix sp.]